MPRPERVRAAERAIIEPEEVAPETPLDETAAAVQSATQEPEESDGFIEELASSLGWAKKDAWRGPPDEFVEARDFLRRTPEVLKGQEDRLRRMAQAMEEVAAESRRQAIREQEERLLAAHRAGDEATVRDAAQRMHAQEPPPQTKAWMAKNPWFWSDEDARNMAANAMRRAQAAGAGIEDQLQAGEDAVRKRFPELFPGLRSNRSEPTLAQVAPQVQGGARAPQVAAPAEKGWGQMPAADRRAFDGFVRKMVRSGIKEDEAQRRLAARYWSDAKATA
ncbi:MAG: hypothetical protein KGL39_55985 [Patescibacteria group bacterium]|nr:hypothetical protein [Patescibacteria group bacterium]